MENRSSSTGRIKYHKCRLEQAVNGEIMWRLCSICSVHRFFNIRQESENLERRIKKKDSHDVYIRQRSRNIARATQRVSVTKILVLAQLTVSTMRSVEVEKYREVYCFHNQINDQSTFWRYDQKERITPALSVMREGEIQQTAQRLFVTCSLKVTLHTTKIKLQFSPFLRYT